MSCLFCKVHKHVMLEPCLSALSGNCVQERCTLATMSSLHDAIPMPVYCKRRGHLTVGSLKVVHSLMRGPNRLKTATL
jgi:hypothetical protein